jgi:hypothetical protein
MPTPSMMKATISGADRLRDGAGSAVPTYAMTFFTSACPSAEEGAAKDAPLALPLVRFALPSSLAATVRLRQVRRSCCSWNSG